MHSTIFQISDQPILPEEYVDIDNVSSGEFTTIDYCQKISDSDRTKLIKVLAEQILPKGMFRVNQDGGSLKYRGGFTEWSGKYVVSLQEKANAIHDYDLYGCCGPTCQLQNAIVNPLDTETLFITNFAETYGIAAKSSNLMRLVGRLQIGAELYFGSIFDFHC